MNYTKIDMQKVTIHPKIKLSLERTPQEVLEIWERTRGIWKGKKIDPLQYLRRIRREWERRIP